MRHKRTHIRRIMVESFNLKMETRSRDVVTRFIQWNRGTTIVVLVLLGAAIFAGYSLINDPIGIDTNKNDIFQEEEAKKKEIEVVCRPKEPTVLVYNRVPKAGSSSMTNLLSKLSKKHGFEMVGWFDMPSHDYESVRDAIQSALKTNKKTVIAQHFHFPEYVDGDRVAYINVMRNPISRCTSQYYYLRYGDRDIEDRKKILEKYGDASIDDCIRSGNLTCFNCEGWKQSIFFCGRDGDICKKMPPNMILERSKTNIDAHYTVGVIEDFEGTVSVMEKLYPSFFKGGLELLGKVKPQRVTKGIEEYIPPNEESKKVITSILQQDMELYDYVSSKLQTIKNMCT